MRVAERWQELVRRDQCRHGQDPGDHALHPGPLRALQDVRREEGDPSAAAEDAQAQVAAVPVKRRRLFAPKQKKTCGRAEIPFFSTPPQKKRGFHRNSNPRDRVRHRYLNGVDRFVWK